MSLENTFQSLSCLGTGCSGSEKVFEKLLIPNKPVLQTVSLMLLNSSVDIYCKFPFELIEFLSLGVSNRLKEFLLSLLKYERKRSTATCAD